MHPLVNETLELVPVQSAMLRESLTGGPSLHIEQVVVNFRENSSVSRIEHAWRETVAATEVLRGRFKIENGEAVGFLLDDGEAAWRENSTEPTDWETWLEQDRRNPLPLEHSAPWRVAFWPEKRLWVWTFHHALLDGRSIARIVKAFLERVDGGSPGFLSMPVWVPPDDATVARAAEFHLKQKALGEPRIPEFPGDLKSSSAVSCALGETIALGLEQAAERMQVTAPTILTWAWGQALAIAAGAECAAIGQVRAGAPQHGCAGFSMQTVPLVITRARKGSLGEHLKTLRANLLAMRDVEQVPVEDLPDLFADFPGNPWPGGVLMVETGSIHHRAGDFPQVRSIELHESAGGGLLASAYVRPELRLVVESDGSTLGPSAAKCLLDQWACIVGEIAKGLPAENDVEKLTRIPPPEQGASNVEDGGKPVATQSVTLMWARSVSEFGKLPALHWGGEVIDYLSLDAKARSLASRLRASGVIAGEPVASLLEDRAELPVVMLALAMTGGVHVPLDPALPAGRRKSILLDSTAQFLIAHEFDDAVQGITVISPESSSAETGTMVPGDAAPDDLLALLYTSGSTGVPKGVMLAHGGVVNEAVAMARMLELSPGDRLLQFASPGFDAALEEIFATLASGATLVPRPDGIAEDLVDFHEFLITSGITVLDLTTAFWAAWCAWMVEEKQHIPSTIRAVVVGGERLSASAAADWKLAGGGKIPLINSYGPTEASVVATVEVLKGSQEKSDPPIGCPLPGVIARIADDTGSRLPEGAAGELWLGGYGVSPGYWRQPERTEGRFVTVEGKRFYRTGDRVYRDTDGKLRFIGRIDNQLKIRGHRVEPEEVKRAVESYPGVGGCHAGLADSHLAAWVKWSGEPPDGWPGLISQYTSKVLPAASVPVRWALVDAFPLTERGKLDILALPTPLLTAGGSSRNEAPVTEAEKRIAEIWQELLDIKTVGRDDSFFDLGGHSLAALRLFAILSREWKLRVPMAALIEAPTPRLLAEFLQHGESSSPAGQSHDPVVVPIRSEGNLAPLFCIHGGDGGVIFYRNVSIHLPPGRPILAIESPALGADEEVRVVPVEQSAADYVKALRKHQPQGPYYLAGYSYGGLLVYEMAAQLIAVGEKINFAGLFDTVNPAAPVRKYSLMERVGVYWNSQQRHHWLDRIFRVASRIREGIGTNLRVKNEIRAARRAGTSEPHSEIRMLRVREAHWTAMEAYQPKRLACAITLFRTQVPDDKYDIPADHGWTNLVDSLEIVEVGGRHLTMFEPRHAGDLAKKIAARI